MRDRSPRPPVWHVALALVAGIALGACALLGGFVMGWIDGVWR